MLVSVCFESLDSTFHGMSARYLALNLNGSGAGQVKRTPLIVAVEHGHKHIAEFLLDNGARLTDEDEVGNPLHVLFIDSDGATLIGASGVSQFEAALVTETLNALYASESLVNHRRVCCCWQLQHNALTYACRLRLVDISALLVSRGAIGTQREVGIVQQNGTKDIEDMFVCLPIDDEV
jgi:hypothetical protein